MQSQLYPPCRLQPHFCSAYKKLDDALTQVAELKKQAEQAKADNAAAALEQGEAKRHEADGQKKLEAAQAEIAEEKLRHVKTQSRLSEIEEDIAKRQEVNLMEASP